MTGLIIFLLLVLAAVYGVFFLFFKLIWILFKKSKNTWPLILAGVSTVLCGVLLVGVTCWGVSKILSPFRPAYERVKANPQPIYGLRTYTDPEYGFTLQVKDGMDYSEWMHFNGASIKLGANTNVFKKGNTGKENTEALLFSILVRQTKNVDPKNPFALLQQNITNTDQFKLQKTSDAPIDGFPAYYFSGVGATNQGFVNLWGQALYDDGAILYAVLFGDEKSIPDAQAESLVSSLRPKALPAPAGETAN